MLLNVLALMMLLLASPVYAAPVAVPDTLAPWVPWVLDSHKDHDCPSPFNNSKARYCAWPATLKLSLDAAGGSFTQQWILYGDSRIPLPGDARYWPQDVMVDGVAATVMQANKRPFIRLGKGEYTIQGRFLWSALPNALTIPAATGLLTLQRNGVSVPLPHREKTGRLWLNENAAPSAHAEEDRLQLQVFRRIMDEVPMQVVTRLDLQVFGKAREISFGPVLLAGAIPLQIKSPVPIRLEADGRVRMQVRPGHWQVDVIARLAQAVSRLSLPQSDMPKTEVWVFDARPSLRQVEVAGVPSLDPRQTTLPSAWQQLPTYRVTTDDTFTLTTKQRGDPEPSANTLSLERDLWLDFDGQAYTFHDNISGQMRQGWRLNMAHEMTLGRAVVNGEGQLVTRLQAQGAQGVELRQGNIAVQADGRYHGDRGSIPMPGWDDHFNQVSATLHLPPGWRLLAASGADSVGRASWLEQWTLLDIFLVLIAALAVYRLFGVPWGVVTLLALTLSWHEVDAPQYIWLVLIAAVALLQVAPQGRLQKAMSWCRYGALLVLVAIALPYMVETVRTAIYPQLERPAVMAYPAMMAERMMDAEPQLAGAPAPESSAGLSKPRAMVKKMVAQRERPLSLYENPTIDPHAKVQTGPGLPEWQWSSVAVRWNGPVEAGQRLDVVYMSPPFTAAMKVLSVLLVLLLGMRLAGFTVQGRRLLQQAPRVMPLLLLLMLFPYGNNASADGFPNAKLLHDLEQRLLKPATCFPQCAQLARMKLDVQGNTLRMMMEVHASEHVAIPVPGALDAWMPQQVMVDGKVHAVRQGVGKGLWLDVSAGIHHIQLAGAMLPVRTMALALPMKPGYATVQADGWRIQGVYNDGRMEDVLHFERIADDADTMNTLQPSQLPAFVTLTRTLHLGLEWRVETVVQRVSDSGQAIALHIPLLPQEAVLTEGIRVADAYANVQLAANQQVLRWQSLLPPSDQITLTAADTQDWAERWQLDVSPIWHVTVQGIPSIHHQNKAGVWFPQWQPWPTEQVQITVNKPLAVVGQTMTIEHSHLHIKPGKRAQDVTLELRIRSSQAGQYALTLPAQAVLGLVTINGISQPIEQRERLVDLPLVPGEQHITLHWQTPQTMNTIWQTPQVNLGQASVNSDIEVAMPASRWVLFLTGPRLGPAVLFWGVLLVVVLVAIGLGYSQRTPLKTWQWLLLGIGLSQAEIGVAMIVVGWLFALVWRKQQGASLEARKFNIVQMGLACLTIAALVGLLSAVGTGLLGHPDMQIQGNGSNAMALYWYADQSGELLPTANILSVPMWFYRALMLLWSLWLAFSLLAWLKWAWQCFSHQGLWQKNSGERR